MDFMILYKVRAYLSHGKSEVCKKKLNVEKSLAFCGECRIFGTKIRKYLFFIPY